MNKEINEYDERNNLVYHKNSDGYEWWKKYDENNNEIYYKNSDGTEWWREYNENNNLIYYKSSNGREYWYKWIDEKKIKITQQHRIYADIINNNRKNMKKTPKKPK